MSYNLGHVHAWNNNIWQLLKSYISKDRVPSALLLSGVAGLGKLDLALRFASLLLCHKPQNNEPCMACVRCKLLENESHIDLIRVAAIDSNVIKIEQIRDLTDKLMTSASDAIYKIAIIEDADCMQEKASNALLKTLEEPRGRTILILLSSKVAQLPITIRSRCSHIPMKAPSKHDLKPHLAEQNIDIDLFYSYCRGAPLSVLDSIHDDTITEIFATMKRSCVFMENSLPELLSKLQNFASYEVVKVSLLMLQDILKYMTFRGSVETFVLTQSDLAKINFNNMIIYKLYKFYDHHIKLLKEIDSQVVWQHKAIVVDLYNNWYKIRS